MRRATLGLYLLAKLSHCQKISESKHFLNIFVVAVAWYKEESSALVESQRGTALWQRVPLWITHQVFGDTLHCTVCTLHCTLCTLHCTLSTLHSTISNAYCTQHNAHSTMHNARSTMHTTHSTLHNTHSALNTIHCTLFMGDCTLQCCLPMDHTL